jgi:hypothetical protein
MKIALIGSAPASVRLAPYKDYSWRIWSWSPGAYATVAVERVTQATDAHFELHRWEPPVIGDASRQVPWFSPEYVEWMRQFRGEVVMSEKLMDVPRSVALPWMELVDKYGPYFMNSSLSWMMALALEQPGIQEIGLFGVDMSATEEYGYQRAGCHYFVTLAMQRGVRITVPPESDLLLPKPLYGIGESHPMMVKLTARMRELDSRIAGATQRFEQAKQELQFLSGARDDCNYQVQTWTASTLLELHLRAKNPVTAVQTSAPAAGEGGSAPP